ncbi:MAG: TonB-dependent receptor [Geodermatophilaceae bacterium]|nr:TonB-dependent receptor [Geodermatophilaceae bacterium]
MRRHAADEERDRRQPGTECLGRATPARRTWPGDRDADLILGPKWITDARISWRLRPRLTVAISGANLLDVYPDEYLDFKDGVNPRGPSMQGIFRYLGALSPFGMSGRTLYLRLAYR